jgi:hypothetical protein
MILIRKIHPTECLSFCFFKSKTASQRIRANYPAMNPFNFKASMSQSLHLFCAQRLSNGLKEAAFVHSGMLYVKLR